MSTARQPYARALALVLALIPAGRARGDDLPRAEPADKGFTAAGLGRVRDLLREAVDRGQVAGAVALVSRRGRVVFFEAAGQRDAEAGRAMTRDTLFRIASMTKPVTSVAALMLVEDGRLKLDEPLATYLPEFARTRVLDPRVVGRDGPLDTVAARRAVTVSDLLTHTSGIAYGFLAPPPLRAAYARAGVHDGLDPAEGTIADNARRLAPLPLLHQPGAAWTYGLNTDVLGRVVEVASKQPLDRFFRERIFGPLKMTDTAFYLDPSRRERLAALYRPGPDRKLVRVGDETVHDGPLAYSASLPYRGPRTYFSGGAGLVSTAADYARFLHMLAAGGRLGEARLLRPETVRAMTTNQIGALTIAFREHGDGFGFGFGVVREAGRGPASVGSYSWGGIYHTYFWVDPEKQLAGVLMTQVFPFDHLTLRTDFQNRVYEALAAAPAPAPKPAPGPGGKRADAAALRQHARDHRGDPKRGKDLFNTLRPTACSACHRVSGQGGDVGPDLSLVGGKFDRPHLVESVLEPSRQIVEGYRTTLLTLTDGRALTGIVREENADNLTLVEADGRRHRLAKSRIEERQTSTTSLMPEGLAEAVTPEQFTDLIAYLESLRAPHAPTPGENTSGPLTLPPGFTATTVATGLSGATALEVAPDGRVFVCEQTGTLRLVKGGRLLPHPVVRLEVDSSWERGLLGVTVDPDFARNHYLYLCHVVPKPYPHHRVSRFTLAGDEAGGEKVLFEGDDQTKLGGEVPAGHQGGATHFGRDGKLYVALGEQTAGAPAQDLHSLLGKLLRINPDGTIPADNPFVTRTTGKYRAIWALGLRNPFTFAVQPGTGRILINDVGGVAEEVNEGAAGANYGWPAVEHGPTSDPRFRGPVHHYPTASITGGAFAPADLAWPQEYRGQYFFMDFVHGWVHVLDPERPARVRPFAAGLRRPVDLHFAPGRTLYVLVRDAWVIDHEFRPGTSSLLAVRFGGGKHP
jgi:putative heme-binding domain-containing protein